MTSLSALAISLAAALVLFVQGVWEKRRNEKNIGSIPIRVNVNGIRGKSTATRLITAILQEAGYKAVGKTTGTSARMIYWDTDEEKELRRRPIGVSLTEQLRVIDEAARLRADALVCECMAVRPEYQKVFQHQMLKATVTVIVNVLEDHLDDMGPTTYEIAYAFAETIPWHGSVVIPDCEFAPLFEEVAKSRHTKVFLADDGEIPQEYLDLFDYKLFAHNCAVALAAARALGIPDEVSFRGMRKARPDPGALRIQKIRKDAVFVNAFAANEPASTLEIWDMVTETDLPWQDPIVVMNCRPDRPDRTRQFIKEFFPLLPACTLVIIGEGTAECRRTYEKERWPNVSRFLCFEGRDIGPIMEQLEEIIDGRVIFGVGNIHGIGHDFMTALVEGVGQPKQDEAGQAAPHGADGPVPLEET